MSLSVYFGFGAVIIDCFVGFLLVFRFGMLLFSIGWTCLVIWLRLVWHFGLLIWWCRARNGLLGCNAFELLVLMV